MNIKELFERAHKTAKEHGWDDEPLNVPEQLCLIHSEVSEALEAYREVGPTELLRTHYEGAKPCGYLSEMADVVIRVGHLIDRQGATDEFLRVLVAKMEHNECRPYRHGGKRC